MKLKSSLLTIVRLVCIFATYAVVFAAKSSPHPLPLHEQSINGTFAGVKMLIDRGENVNQPDSLGMTPLHYAAAKGKLATVRLLVEHGALVSSKDNSGMTPLHHAAGRGRALTVKWLLERGGAMRYANEQDNLKRTPLHYAAASISRDTVKYLIEVGGAKVNIRDNMGKIPLQYARGVNVENVQSYVDLQLLLSCMKSHSVPSLEPNSDSKVSQECGASVAAPKICLKSDETNAVSAVVSKICLKPDETFVVSAVVPKVCLSDTNPRVVSVVLTKAGDERTDAAVVGSSESETNRGVGKNIVAGAAGSEKCSKKSVTMGTNEVVPGVGLKRPRLPVRTINSAIPVLGASSTSHNDIGSSDYTPMEAAPIVPILPSIEEILESSLDDFDYPYGWEYYALFYPSLLKPEHRLLLFGHE